MERHKHADKHPETIKAPISGGDSQFVAIICAVIIVFITLVIFAIWRRKKSARRGILFVGLSDSGKTLIFSRLLHNKFVLTHTSIKENVEDYIIDNGFLKIVDIPGHERLRSKYFDQYKSVIRGIVFVIDSVTFQKDIRDVADYLYTILCDPVVLNNGIPFLILCNKQDQTMAKGCKVIQNLLEKELTLVRQTKSSQLDGINDTSVSNAFLGKQGKDFEFSHVHPTKVEFAEATAFDKDADNPAELSSLLKWLQNCA